MNIYLFPNGDAETGDFPSRKKHDWTNVAWIVTHQCTLGCPYCIGWKSRTPDVTAINKIGIDGVVRNFEKLRENAKKDVYLIVSGGEPSMVPNLNKVFSELGKRGFILELHTNLVTGNFMEFLDGVDPKYMGQFMATYHPWALEKNKEFHDRYIRNMTELVSRGFTGVFKVIIPPTEFKDLEQNISRWQREIPHGTPLLPWIYIKDTPYSSINAAGAYPQAYTVEQRDKLKKVTKFRNTTQQAYCRGGGFFKGMLCSAGSGFLYMDIDGNVFRCFTCRNLKNLGSLLTGEFNIMQDNAPCPNNYCSTVCEGLWYGVDPWRYTPGEEEKDCYYCRFGPKVPGI